MDKKIYVFDVGNTLIVKSDKTISQATCDALKSLRQSGNIVGIASMRNKEQLMCIKPMTTFDFFIGLNGSYVESNGNVVIESPLSSKDMESIYGYVSENRMKCVLHTKTNLISADDWHNEKVFVVELFNVEQQVERLTNFLGNRFTYHIWERGKTCDIYSKTVSKSIALQKICIRYGMNGQNCIAFGDGFNDIELFKFCGKSVAMATAPDELKKVATYITKSAKDDGVVWALNNYKL